MTNHNVIKSINNILSYECLLNMPLSTSLIECNKEIKVIWHILWHDKYLFYGMTPVS